MLFPYTLFNWNERYCFSIIYVFLFSKPALSSISCPIFETKLSKNYLCNCLITIFVFFWLHHVPFLIPFPVSDSICPFPLVRVRELRYFTYALCYCFFHLFCPYFQTSPSSKSYLTPTTSLETCNVQCFTIHCKTQVLLSACSTQLRSL